MPEESKSLIFSDLETKFEFLMEQLRVVGTRRMVDHFVRPVSVLPPPPPGLG
jgi:hypothetical protein